MTAAFDNRLVQLEVQLIGSDGQNVGPLYTFDQQYYILATGTKFTDGSLGECAIRIDNIAKDTRDFLVNKTSPWIPTRAYANMTLSVGRQSTGAFVLYTGQGTASNPSQPPDIGLTLTSLTMGVMLGNIGSLNAGATATLSQIAAQIAAQLPNPLTGQLGIPLSYQAKANQQIRNYSFNGALINQIHELNMLGGVNAFIDNNTLVVLDANAPRNASLIIINENNGMVGVPEVNELGVSVKMLIGPEIRPGDAVTVQSVLNPAANGTFIVYRCGFEIASRAQPFYWNLDMRAISQSVGFITQ